mmetsp:Transcript_20591/g.57246  ORF Transcript_20591/g.57246 Transcript_20591/m.57246 type:complete len:971 (-) Transcript_20591:71-2983(-)
MAVVYAEPSYMGWGTARTRSCSGPAGECHRGAPFQRDAELFGSAASHYGSPVSRGVGGPGFGGLACRASKPGDHRAALGAWCRGSGGASVSADAKSPMPSSRMGSATAPATPTQASPTFAPHLLAHLGHQNQLDELVDRVDSMVAGLQRQVESERRVMERRFQHLERQMQAAVCRIDNDRIRDEGREKWAEFQGSLNGLIDEAQALARRVDGLDERVWTRTNGAEEVARQGLRELQQQLQASERQGRLAQATAEETQRRQAAKQRRTEHMLEDFAWRLAQAEEQATKGDKTDPQLERRLEATLETSERRAREYRAEMDTLIRRLEAFEAQAAEDRQGNATVRLSGVEEEMSVVPDAMGTLERDLGQLQRTVSTQLEELAEGMAAMRVKLDSQSERLNSFATRLETVHVPAVEAVRSDLSEEHARHFREIEGRMAELIKKVEFTCQTMDSEGLVESVERLECRMSASETQAAAQRREMQEIQAEFRKASERVQSSRADGRPATTTEKPDEQPRFVTTDAVRELQEHLTMLASQLEAVDELATTVSRLDTRVSLIEKRRGDEDIFSHGPQRTLCRDALGTNSDGPGGKAEGMRSEESFESAPPAVWRGTSRPTGTRKQDALAFAHADPGSGKADMDEDLGAEKVSTAAAAAMHQEAASRSWPTTSGGSPNEASARLGGGHPAHDDVASKPTTSLKPLPALSTRLGSGHSANAEAPYHAALGEEAPPVQTNRQPGRRSSLVARLSGDACAGAEAQATDASGVGASSSEPPVESPSSFGGKGIRGREGVGGGGGLHASDPPQEPEGGFSAGSALSKDQRSNRGSDAGGPSLLRVPRASSSRLPSCESLFSGEVAMSITDENVRGSADLPNKCDLTFDVLPPSLLVRAGDTATNDTSTSRVESLLPFGAPEESRSAGASPSEKATAGVGGAFGDEQDEAYSPGWGEEHFSDRSEGGDMSFYEESLNESVEELPSS